MVAIGEYCGLSTAFEVFLMFTTQLCNFKVCILYLHYLVTRLKYSFLNTPNLQYLVHDYNTFASVPLC